MHPRDANQAAKDEGLRQFEETPDLEAFQVMEEWSWTLEMVLAWIIWRQPSRVTRYFAPFRQQVIYWRPILQRGEPSTFNLEVLRPADLRIVENDSGWQFAYPDEAEQVLLDFADAKNNLWKKLAAGHLTCRAISKATLKPTEIPAVEWSYLDVARAGRGPTELLFVPSMEAAYSDLTFITSEVLAQWPSQPESGSTLPKPSRGRREKYNWPAFHDEAIRKLDEEGNFNPANDVTWNQAALERHMADWCSANWLGDEQPGESTIRDRVRRAYKAYLASFD